MLLRRLLGFALLLGCNNDSTPPDAAAYPAPQENCNLDGGMVCAPPIGGCADPHWLYYYDNGQCQNDRCTFETKFFYCANECVDRTFMGREGCLNTGETAPYSHP